LCDSGNNNRIDNTCQRSKRHRNADQNAGVARGQVEVIDLPACSRKNTDTQTVRTITRRIYCILCTNYIQLLLLLLCDVRSRIGWRQRLLFTRRISNR
jgi:hypothetical protein